MNRKYLLTPMLLLLIVLLSGCQSFGSGMISSDKADYTDAVAESMKVQMLLNIVKLRYGDMPLFLDVKSVIKSYSLEYRLAAGADIYPDFEPNASIGGTYADKPTISYAPLVGEAYAESMMKPISPAYLVQLIQAGANPELAFRLLCEEINGISNRRTRGLNVRSADDDFNEITRLLAKIQDDGYMDLQVRTQDDDVLLVITQIPGSYPNPDVIELKQLLGLSAEVDSYRLIYGLLPGNRGEIAMLTRSMYSVLMDLAADVEIPEDEISDGRATTGYPDEDRLVRIHSESKNPEDAFVKVQYRGRWYWIDDTDIETKRTLSNLLTLFTLAGTGLDRVAPILTIPTG